MKRDRRTGEGGSGCNSLAPGLPTANAAQTECAMKISPSGVQDVVVSST
jgi:hypothetical protein